MLPCQLVIVRGPSMVPTLRDGDRVIARHGAAIRPGEVVLATYRSMPGILVVKRLDHRVEDGWWLSSDNAYAGGGSDRHGIADVHARVVLRIRGWRAHRVTRVAGMSWNDNVISEFRAGKPRVADMFDLGALLLVHTTGAKTGQERVSPVAFLTIDNNVIIIASAAGAPKHPAWYLNLVAQPQIEVERWRDGELRTEPVTAEVVPEGAERDALWERVVRLASGFGEYQKKTSRVIPLIKLVPRT